MKKEINILYFYFYLLIILVIFVYLWVFDVMKDANNTILIGLENMGVNNFLIDSNQELDLLKFYETPSKTPYIDISIGYIDDPLNLVFSIVDSDSIKVSTNSEIIKEVANFKTIRITFVNKGSTYYKIRYKLKNNPNVEIIRMELKV